MRRSLTLTVAAATTMVLLAMLVPMAVLLRSYVLEDRLAQAALEVQTTESVVSVANGEEGSISSYVDKVNADGGNQTTVVLPGGASIGPEPGAEEQARIAEARTTGTARVDDVDGGTVILVPVSLGRSTPGPEDTPVIRVFVPAPGWESDLVRSWAILLALGVSLLAGALLLADRLGRSFVTPLGDLASYAARLGVDGRPEPPPPDGPEEVRELGVALHRLVGRVEVLLERERAGIADVSHRLRTPMTSLRLRVDGLADPDERSRIGEELDQLQATVDAVVREARRSEREGLTGVVDGVAALADRVRWWAPLAEDQGRSFSLVVDVEGPVAVRAGADDLAALVDVLLDNAFTHTPDDAAVLATVDAAPSGGVRLVVEDAGPGLPDGDVVGRGTSGGGSTGLGLSIADRTAAESGGGLETGRSAALGGARVAVVLGAG
ncbi:HAMP domain-containing sensor histidine kinase [Nocardioides sp.]|uniref:sensor histidine kinase n=1 Tax=Nocardioides sp. TaxID=35761 RepID=UPI00271BAEFA|nr:HAMP domain-containing sensor histidine kinase [Nocardioides sp.]MDO9456806.1 HAMP domain-containing sensor histidine kinase [Nocardioides sp.]